MREVKRDLFIGLVAWSRMNKDGVARLRTANGSLESVRRSGLASVRCLRIRAV